ncbi:MAG: TonB-dependent receptor [Myxococcales bacterium]|nr:TonB-dependent receptor [Myxococcales bacterium]
MAVDLLCRRACRGAARLVCPLLLGGLVCPSWAADNPSEGPPAAAAAPPPADPPAAPATVMGRVLDGLSGNPMLGAFVEAEGTEYQTTTDARGAFSLTLPPGSYTLQVAQEAYQVHRQAITLAPGQVLVLPRPVRLQPEMASGRVTINVVREPDRNSTEAQNLQRQASARVSDVISAEEIQRSGDSSAAQAAARVVGATVVGDRFVYVRGLGERYAHALFNGAPLPSPEPDQQAVPFDLFPASLLANLTVAKSATADIPGDFAGGSVQINAREFPSRRTLNLSLGLGANLNAAFQPFLTYPGGRADVFGIDDGTRQPPSDLPPGLRAPDGTLLPRAEVARLARRFPPVWVPRQAALGPVDHSLSASVGDQLRLGERRLGYLLAVSYGASFQTRTPELHVYNLDGGVLRSQVDLTGQLSLREVQWGALGNLVLSPAAGHLLTLTGLFAVNSDDEARVLAGYSLERNTDVWTSRLRFVSRSMGFVQLSGSHQVPGRRLGPGELEWRASYAYAARAEPDNREVFYLRLGERYSFFNSGHSGQRFYSGNSEHQVGAGLDFTQPFRQWAGLPARFKVGALLRHRLRGFSAQRYQFFSYGRGAAGEPIDFLPPEELLGPTHISEQNGVGVELRDNTLPSDRYTGHMGLYAGYALVDLPLHPRLRLVLGGRFELWHQSLDTRDINGNAVLVSLLGPDFLPSGNLIFRAAERMNLRLAASLTVARPEFRELSPFQFTDYYGGELVRGNPELQRTRIFNADLRWEWFLGAVDLVALSAFYKYFDRPIETTITPGGNLIRSYANATSAHNAGLELEGRKELSFLSRALRGLSLGGNASWIFSRVDLSQVQGVFTSRERPLQGQSPFVVNVMLEYDRPDWGLQARVLYNVFGERIDQVGALGLPDRYQQPRHMLDVSITQALGRSGFALRLAGRNLLDAPVHVTQEGETALLYRTGRVVTLSLAYNR